MHWAVTQPYRCINYTTMSLIIFLRNVLNQSQQHHLLFVEQSYHYHRDGCNSALHSRFGFGQGCNSAFRIGSPVNPALFKGCNDSLYRYCMDIVSTSNREQIDIISISCQDLIMVGFAFQSRTYCNSKLLDLGLGMELQIRSRLALASHCSQCNLNGLYT